MKKLIIILLLFSCSKEDDITPQNFNSFCIYKRPETSTNAQDIGLDRPWKLVNCVDNPYHTISSTKYKGYQSTDCNCRDSY